VIVYIIKIKHEVYNANSYFVLTQ